MLLDVLLLLLLSAVAALATVITISTTTTTTTTAATTTTTVQVLIYTAGHINYGGRVTDDWDRRCMMNVLHDYYNDIVLNVGHLYDASAIYKQIEPTTDLEVICCLLWPFRHTFLLSIHPQ